MANKLNTKEDLLIGKTYRSRTRHFEGEFVSADKRDGIWYGDNTEAYLIEINNRTLRNKYATIAVRIGE